MKLAINTWNYIHPVPKTLQMATQYMQAVFNLLMLEVMKDLLLVEDLSLVGTLEVVVVKKMLVMMKNCWKNLIRQI